MCYTQDTYTGAPAQQIPVLRARCRHHAAVVDAVVDAIHLSKLMHHKHSCAAGHALLEVALLRVAGDTLVVLPVLERLA
jgi:hypothetical protein